MKKLAAVILLFCSIPAVCQSPKRSIIHEVASADLAANPAAYMQRTVLVHGLILSSIESWEEFICGMTDYSPCLPRGGPFNPRCEYIVTLLSNEAMIRGCIPRSKILSLANTWVMQSNVSMTGILDPGQTVTTEKRDCMLFMHDIQLFPPRDRRSEKWPGE